MICEPLTRVADHLPHLYEDTVHAGRHAAPPPRHASSLRLPEQGVGDVCCVVTKRGIVIILGLLPPSSPAFNFRQFVAIFILPANILHSTSHRS